MPLEFEYHGLTGAVGGVSDALIPLRHAPVSSILVDPIQGPSQKQDIDWGITGISLTYNLSGSTIRKIREDYIRENGVDSVGPTLRVIYEY